MYRHHDEDEYTYVQTGRIGATLGGLEVVGGPGDLIFKPRDQWHTFWNGGDEPAVVMEIISLTGPHCAQSRTAIRYGAADALTDSPVREE